MRGAGGEAVGKDDDKIESISGAAGDEALVCFGRELPPEVGALEVSRTVEGLRGGEEDGPTVGFQLESEHGGIKGLVDSVAGPGVGEAEVEQFAVRQLAAGASERDPGAGPFPQGMGGEVAHGARSPRVCAASARARGFSRRRPRESVMPCVSSQDSNSGAGRFCSTWRR